MLNKYAVFIITHGRADRQLTYKYFLNSCIEDLFLIVDNEDNQLEQYQKKYSNKVVVFNKKHYINTIDTVINKRLLNHPVYARNAVYDIAEKMGYRYFFVIDDDIKMLQLRYSVVNKLKSHAIKAKNLCFILDSLVNFMKNSKACLIGIPNESAFIGGIKSSKYQQGYVREVTNFYLCDTKNKIHFISALHDDITTNSMLNNRGCFIISPTLLMQTFDHNGNKKGGGMKNIYDDYGLYSMIFSAVIVAPNTIKVKSDKAGFGILRKNKQYPLILSDQYKKVKKLDRF